MAVPHTRPVSVTAHATDQRLLGDHESWLQRVQVPASVGNLLEFRLGQAGHDAMGYAAHVPHYLAQTNYPAAAELLLDSVSASTGLTLPTGDAARGRRAGPRRGGQAGRRRRAGRPPGRLAGGSSTTRSCAAGRATCWPTATGPLPTAEELGAELERFLAEQSRDDRASSGFRCGPAASSPARSGSRGPSSPTRASPGPKPLSSATPCPLAGRTNRSFCATRWSSVPQRSISRGSVAGSAGGHQVQQVVVACRPRPGRRRPGRSARACAGAGRTAGCTPGRAHRRGWPRRRTAPAARSAHLKRAVAAHRQPGDEGVLAPGGDPEEPLDHLRQLLGEEGPEPARRTPRRRRSCGAPGA